MLAALALLAAAAYELAVALKWIPMGHDPGDEPAGQAVVTGVAFLAFLVGIVASAFATIRDRPARGAFLLPLAAAAYLVTHYYAFDPYYLPTLRRYSESGVSATWVYGVCAGATLVAALVRFRPRIGLALMPLLLLVCAVTVLGLGIGH